jgi:hypothetical protein
MTVKVPSALKRLTAEFGMGSGVSTSLEAPETLISKCFMVCQTIPKELCVCKTAIHRGPTQSTWLHATAKPT